VRPPAEQTLRRAFEGRFGRAEGRLVQVVPITGRQRRFSRATELRVRGLGRPRFRQQLAERRVGLCALAAALGLFLAMAAFADPGKNSSSTSSTVTTSTNNGGNNPNCGNACSNTTANPTDYTKPCDPVPGNGCHQLPDTPCERGHGGTEIGNKHCGGNLTIVKEQSTSYSGPFTHDSVSLPVGYEVWYEIIVTNNTNEDYTLVGSDPLCDDNTANASTALTPSGPQTVPAGGTFTYTCNVDTYVGGVPGITHSGGPLTNTVTVTATPVGGGTPVTLTDSVTATLTAA
jgi:hypothetical protein